MPTSASDPFDRLDERLRAWVYRQGWQELRPGQRRSIPAVLDTSDDIALFAPTSAGKTEAAFLPVLTRVAQVAGSSVRVLVISPLKALINDQFGRLDLICEALDLPVHRWHGDVSANRKRDVLRNPAGVLLITPESLEALLMNHGPAVRRTFADLEFVVLDEIHAMMGTERGVQVQSLLHRLEIEIGRRVRRFGLSATVAEPDQARRFLRPEEPDRVLVLDPEEDALPLRATVKVVVDAPEEDLEDDDEALVKGESSLRRVAEDVFARLRTTHNLVFSNRREQVEQLTDLLTEIAERERIPSPFLAHHGNLAKEYREEAEARLRSAEQPVTVVCTSTLELGIDIGDVASVAQIEPPPSVASLRQRVGRSGRRKPPSVLRNYVFEQDLGPSPALGDELRLATFQAIASLELMIEGFLEPAPDGALHLSTLVQQTLSVIVQRGGATPGVLYRDLIDHGPFATVSKEQYVALLRSLKDEEMVLQSEDGTVLLAPKGERIAGHYAFYAAFSTPEEYRLVADGKPLGTLPITYPVRDGDYLLFGGRRWQVVAVDDVRKVIDLKRTRGRKPPRFGGEDAAVHRAVRERMRSLYLRVDEPAFADPAARRMLSEGRAAFARAGLADRSLLDRERRTLIVPWAGDRETSTLRLLLGVRKLPVQEEAGILEVAASVPTTLAALEAIAGDASIDPVALAAGVGNKRRNKHDWVLTEPLLNAEFAAGYLDVEGARALAGRLVADSRPVEFM